MSIKGHVYSSSSSDMTSITDPVEYRVKLEVFEVKKCGYLPLKVIRYAKGLEMYGYFLHGVCID
jgi:hypothetical protein